MFAFIKNFKRDESGLALTEYLILLGLLTAVVVAAVLVFGNNLGVAWAGWANWLSGVSANGLPPTTLSEAQGIIGGLGN